MNTKSRNGTMTSLSRFICFIVARICTEFYTVVTGFTITATMTLYQVQVHTECVQFLPYKGDYGLAREVSRVDSKGQILR